MASHDGALDVSLAKLAEGIRHEIEQSDRDWAGAVQHAVRAGKLLTVAKARVPHGQWLPWLEETFPKSPRSAQGYMRLANNAEKTQALAHLGVEGALKRIAAPKEATEAKNPTPGLETHPSVDEAWSHVLPLDRYFHQHHIVSSVEREAEIRNVCEIAGVTPLFEDMPAGETIPKVWTGYFDGELDEESDVDLVYHPGWASYCRDRLDGKVEFATEEMMPALLDATQ